MKKYNNEIIDELFETCERVGDIVNVGPEFYNDFLAFTDKNMKALIVAIIIDRADDINKKILSNTWKKDEDIYKYIQDFLELFFLGILFIREKILS